MGPDDYPSAVDFHRLFAPTMDAQKRSLDCQVICLGHGRSCTAYSLSMFARHDTVTRFISLDCAQKAIDFLTLSTHVIALRAESH